MANDGKDGPSDLVREAMEREGVGADNVVQIGGGKRPGVNTKGDPDKLTHKQQGFVNSILAGEDQSTAYRQNYDTSRSTDKTIHEAACRLMLNSKVAARLTAGFKRMEAKALNSAAMMRVRVEKVLMDATHEDKPDNIRLRGAELMGKLAEVQSFNDAYSISSDNLTDTEVLAELETKLKAAFAK